MDLSLTDVEYIANLARLDLNDIEKQLYRVQLSEILDYAARLREVDTSGIPPTARISLDESRLREDQPKAGLSLRELLSNAPESEEGYFKVPPVLD